MKRINGLIGKQIQKKKLDKIKILHFLKKMKRINGLIGKQIQKKKLIKIKILHF